MPGAPPAGPIAARSGYRPGMGEFGTGVATAVVLIAHGSRAEAANEAHRTAAAQLEALVGGLVLPAFLELAEPSIGAAIDHAAGADATRILVLPYFLYPGRHLTEDIPAQVDAAAAKHPTSHVELLPAFGADPGVLGLLAAQIHAAAAEPGHHPGHPLEHGPKH